MLASAQQVNHVIVLCDDPERMKTFYRDEAQHLVEHAIDVGVNRICCEESGRRQVVLDGR